MSIYSFGHAKRWSMKIKRCDLLYLLNVFICIVFFNIQSISQIPTLDKAVDLLRLFFFAIFLTKWLKLGRFHLYQLAIIALFIARVLSTFIAGDRIVSVFSLYFPIISIMMFIEINRDELSMLIKAIYAASGILILGNTITLVVFPGGLYTTNYGWNLYWLIGQKQDWNVVYIAFFISSLLLWNETKLKLFSFWVYSMMVYSFIVQLPLGLVLFFFITVSLLLFSKKRRLLKAKDMFIVNVILEVLLIVVAYLFEIISWINELLSKMSANEILTKRDTMLSRVNMWRDGLGQFVSHPILGVGNVSEDRWSDLFHLSSYHPNFHNTPIDIMVTSGMIGIIAYVLVYVYVAKRLDASMSRNSMIITYGIFGINILMLVEGVYAPFVWFFIFIGIYIKDLDKEIESVVPLMIGRIDKNEIFSVYRPWNR